MKSFVTTKQKHDFVLFDKVMLVFFILANGYTSDEQDKMNVRYHIGTSKSGGNLLSQKILFQKK